MPAAKVACIILAPDVRLKGHTAACSALLQLGGQPVVDFWLQAVRSCRRCQPLADQVQIVCSAESAPALQDWAAHTGVVPPGAIHASAFPGSTSSGGGGGSDGSTTSTSTGASSAQHGSQAASLLARLQQLLQERHQQLQAQHVLVVDTSQVLEPGTDLSHLVEEAVVRGTDLLTGSSLLPGAQLAQLMQVVVDDAGTQVLSVSPAAASATPPEQLLVLGPVLVAAPGSLTRHATRAQDLLAAAASAAPPPQQLNLGPGPGAWLGAAMGCGGGGARPWCAALDGFFGVGNQGALELADGFFSEYLSQQGRLRQRARGVAVGVEGRRGAALDGTIAALSRRLAQMAPRPTAAAPAAAAAAAGGAAGPSLSGLYLEYYEKHQQRASCRAAPAAARDYKALPMRFQDPSGRPPGGPPPRAQHACYTTTSAEYGARAPGQMDMPLVWSGAVGGFTDTFHGGCYVAMGLQTGMARSKVHRALDGAW